MPTVKRTDILDLWNQTAPPETTFDTPVPVPDADAAAAAAVTPATEETPAAVQAALGHWSDDAAPTEEAALPVPIAAAVASVDEAAAAGPVPEVVAPVEELDGVPAQAVAAAEQGVGADTLSKDDAEKELKLVAPALTEGPNAKEAQSAYQKIAILRENNPEVARRLSPELVAMLVEGVADANSEADSGNGPEVGAAQVAAAAETILYMPGEAYDRLNAALGQAGLKIEGEGETGETATAERALMLSALAEKHDAMLAGGAQAQKAIAELTTLEGQLGGQKPTASADAPPPIEAQFDQDPSDSPDALA